MRYKYRIDSRTRDFIELQIECLQENEKLLAEIRADMMPRMISRYDESSGVTNYDYRPTEDAALRITSSAYIFQLELSVNAVRSVYERLSDEDKELIRMKYWSGNRYAPDAIAMKLNMARTTVYDRLNNILFEVGRKLGFVNLWGE